MTENASGTSRKTPRNDITEIPTRWSITDDEAHGVLAAGGAVWVGKLTMTAAADGSSVTLTDPAGGSRTFRSPEEFDDAVAEAWAAVGLDAGGRKVAEGAAGRVVDEHPARAAAITAAGKALANGVLRRDSLSPRAAAEEAHDAGGLPVDELERRIIAQRAAQSGGAA